METILPTSRFCHRRGEWAKAKEAIAAGEDINYEEASGAIEFDGNRDVAGTYSLNVVGDPRATPRMAGGDHALGPC